MQIQLYIYTISDKLKVKIVQSVQKKFKAKTKKEHLSDSQNRKAPVWMQTQHSFTQWISQKSNLCSPESHTFLGFLSFKQSIMDLVTNFWWNYSSSPTCWITSLKILNVFTTERKNKRQELCNVILCVSLLIFTLLFSSKISHCLLNSCDKENKESKIHNNVIS